MDTVNALMVWGSLLASAVLGGFLLVQASFHPTYRLRFGVFAIICFTIALVDFMRANITPDVYEMRRVFAWSFYGAGVYLVFSGHWLRSLAIALFTHACGWIAWHINWQIATTIVVPLGFYIAAFTHIRQYLRNQAFGSCVLGTYALLKGVLCNAYFSIAMNGVPALLTLGYGHYLSLMVFSVIFGWINIPREMENQIPVTVKRKHAAWHGAVLITGEALLITLFLQDTANTQLILGMALCMAMATLMLYFHQRHNLVIYTNDIAGLLEERTKNLRDAEAQLREVNQKQSDTIQAQDKDIQNQQGIIERQTRLELAGQAAGQAAHDIQNLISPLLTQLNVIDQHAQDPGQVKKTAVYMRESVEHLLEANSQMLASSRRGRVELAPLVLDDVVFSLRQNFTTLTIHGADAPLWVNGSYAQLHRALTNLIKNAFDAVNRQGTGAHVTLYIESLDLANAQECHLGVVTPGQYIRLQVVDNGPGIPADHWDRIFEPFYSSKPQGQHSGTGLGLSIVQGIIEDHKGVLDVSSDAKGTCFSIYLPQAAAPQANDHLTLSPQTTILVVDDDNLMREHLVKTLQDSGATVHQSGRGKAALKQIARHDIDILVLDIRLPQSSGTQIYFDALHLKPNVKAVVHSSYIAEPERNYFTSLGVTHFLTKPASPRQLISSITETLNTTA